MVVHLVTWGPETEWVGICLESERMAEEASCNAELS
jgi:hypothetical protein